MNIFKIETVDIKNKIRNLTAAASGKVQSTKHFPVFLIDGKEKIFKPLSKTKPLQTPLFSYSEVYWSYLINKYIDNTTPVYQLAYCKDLDKEQPKYYCKGCLVDNILTKDEKLINLLELYRKYPDSTVDIDDYTNYCEVEYDYEKILKSDFFTLRTDLRRNLAKQILASILRRDANYHYENVAFIEENGIQRIAPIIDLEFSEMFMYPDKERHHQSRFSEYDEGLTPIFTYNQEKTKEENNLDFIDRLNNGTIYDKGDRYHFSNIMKNLKTIVQLEPNLVKDFIKRLESMKVEVENLEIDFNDEFLGEFSSDDWESTRMLLKENVKETDEVYLRAKEKSDASKIKLNQHKFNTTLKKETLWSIDKLIETLKLYLDINENKFDIASFQKTTLYKEVERIPEELLMGFYSLLEKKKEKENIKMKNNHQK